MHLSVDDDNSHEHKYDHPGGVQLIGDYLVVPVQTQDYKQSIVQLWDLSPLRDDDLAIKKIGDNFLPKSNAQETGGNGLGLPATQRVMTQPCEINTFHPKSCSLACAEL